MVHFRRALHAATYSSYHTLTFTNLRWIRQACMRHQHVKFVALAPPGESSYQQRYHSPPRNSIALLKPRVTKIERNFEPRLIERDV
ncbi:Uncharacterized protein HZ326_30872 [Fusarium oxysporum f. sp. albedinis]|nr:Uncharacterized protein HZ326_30872 [Fusarium oxysporum f. sp. albedinis]